MLLPHFPPPPFFRHLFVFPIGEVHPCKITALIIFPSGGLQKGGKHRGATDSQKTDLIDTVLGVLHECLLRLDTPLSHTGALETIGYILDRLLYPGNALRLRKIGVELLVVWIDKLRSDLPLAVLQRFATALRLPESSPPDAAAIPLYVDHPSGVPEHDLAELVSVLLDAIGQIAGAEPTPETLAGTFFLLELWHTEYLILFYPALTERLGICSLLSNKILPSGRYKPGAGRQITCPLVVHDAVAQWYIRWLSGGEVCVGELFSCCRSSSPTRYFTVMHRFKAVYACIRRELHSHERLRQTFFGIFYLSLLGPPVPTAKDESGTR